MRQIAIFVVVAPLIGCGSGGAEQGQAAVQDSAGIVIVENGKPLWDNAEAWRVAPEPVLQIGQLHGDEPYVFSSIVQALRLSNGSIVVADGNSRQLRFFDSEGRHTHSVGRHGGGPGEFQLIAGVALIPGDSLVIVDPASRRISIVHADGGVARSLPIPEGVSVFQPLGHIAGRIFGYSVDMQFQTAVGRDSLGVVAVAPDGSGGMLVARLPGESHEYARGFGPTPVIAGAQDGFWYGSGDSYELRRYDANAELQLISRVSRSPVAVPAEMIAYARQHEADLAASTGMPVTERRIPHHLPPYAAAQSDSQGHLWVLAFGPEQTSLWNVLDGDGHYLGDVELPDGAVPFQIGSDFVLTRGWDELGTEFVRLYRLEKPLPARD